MPSNVALSWEPLGNTKEVVAVYNADFVGAETFIFNLNERLYQADIPVKPNFLSVNNSNNSNVVTIGMSPLEFSIPPASSITLSIPTGITLISAFSTDGLTRFQFTEKRYSSDLIDANFTGGSNGSVETGFILAYSGLVSPSTSNWLLCNGNPISRTEYSALFDVIGTVYGIGDGVNTFNIPDLRGRVIAGVDGSANRLTTAIYGSDPDVRGNTGGQESVTLTIAQIPPHNHTLTTSGGGAPKNVLNPPANSTSGSVTGNEGGGQSHTNTQPTMVLDWYIKT